MAQLYARFVRLRFRDTRVWVVQTDSTPTGFIDVTLYRLLSGTDTQPKYMHVILITVAIYVHVFLLLMKP